MATDEMEQLLRRISDSMKSTGTTTMKLFKQLDSDHDGFVGMSDLAGLLLAFEPQCRAVVLSEIFQRFGLDRKQCISEGDFVAAWDQADTSDGTNNEGPTMQFRWMPGPPGRQLHSEETAQLLDLVQSNLTNVAPETNDLEYVIPGHPEAVWARELYLAYYERQTERLERLMHRTQARSSKEAFYFSLFEDQCEMISSEFYIWRIRSPGLLSNYFELRGNRIRGNRSELLAWHGASGDLHHQALQTGELRPAGQMLNGLQPWLLASQPLQTFGKGPEWTVFYLCMVNVKDSEMTRSSVISERGRVLPLYCLVHPSIWHTWPSGEWP